jgi:hypothetical protein
METVTVQGPVVLLPAEDYRQLLDRIARLESILGELAQQLQDREDIRFMLEGEADDERGEGRPLEEFVAELRAGRFEGC